MAGGILVIKNNRAEGVLTLKNIGAKNKAIKVLRIMPLLAGAVLALLLFNREAGEIFGGAVLAEMAENKLYLAAFIVLMYAVKSISIVLPIMALQIGTGAIFPPATAILINLIGLFVSATVSFYLGKIGGKEYMERVTAKYERADDLKSLYSDNEFFSSYLLRVIRILPMDIVSMFLGSLGVNYKDYLLGSVAGMLPGMLAATVMGTSIEDPSSPAFVLSTAATVAITVVSIAIYRKRLKKSKDTEK